MHPILFRIGSYVVYSYTVAVSLGVFAGTGLACRLAPKRSLSATTVLDAAFWALVGGIIGGRIAYVLSNWAYYAQHLEKAVRAYEGGLHWHGAFLGGLATVVIWLALQARLHHDAPPWLDVLDVAAPGLGLGGALGWIGSLLTGSAYGAEAAGSAPPLSWLAVRLPDIYGIEAMRFATQPIMALWCLVVGLVLWRRIAGLAPGLAFAAHTFLYALADFGVRFLRGDETVFWGLRLWQWVALAEGCAALAFAAWVYVRQRKRRLTQHDPN